jgi:catechol 2,3-dioxygenase-like lactoylglutathione lyase family enzyme
MKAKAILETVLYAEDLTAARKFYEKILGLECFAEEEGRDVFFRCGQQVLLVFNPNRTSTPSVFGENIIPPHGSHGGGHLCFRASKDEIDAWRTHLEAHDVKIEADFHWPNGARSIYFRDPAGNCIEFGEPSMWGLPP